MILENTIVINYISLFCIFYVLELELYWSIYCQTVFIFLTYKHIQIPQPQNYHPTIEVTLPYPVIKIKFFDGYHAILYAVQVLHIAALLPDINHTENIPLHIVELKVFLPQSPNHFDNAVLALILVVCGN